MKNKKLWIVFISVLLSVFLFSVVGNADFGDYAGDSDYGDSWDSGWDSDDYDSGDDDWDWGSDDDDDSPGWFSGSSSSGSSSSGYSTSSDDTLNLIVGILVVSVISALILFKIIRAIVEKITDKNRRKNRNYAPNKATNTYQNQNKYVKKVIPPGAKPMSAASLQAMSEFQSIDPGFSFDALCEQISNRYIQFQNAWQNKDISSLRPYLTDAFYAQMDLQLDQYRKKKQTNYVERIAVLGVELVGWRHCGNVDEIVARLRTRIVDYVTSDETGAVIHGSKTAEKFMEYEWTLVREAGIVTGENDGVTVHNCPNCGAALNINQTAKCEYCGSIVTVNAHEWAVSSIKGLSQRTSG